jgi:hypothetical protein
VTRRPAAAQARPRAGRLGPGESQPPAPRAPAATAPPHDAAPPAHDPERRGPRPRRARVVRSPRFGCDGRRRETHDGAPAHATPTNNLVYVTEDRPDAFLRKLATQAGRRAGDVFCFGHTHRPWHRAVDGVHFVNIGSVGRPKDGDWRTGYVLLDVADG